MHDFLCKNSKDEYYYDALRERIKYIKDEPEEVNEVSLLVERYAMGLAEKAAKEAAEKATEKAKKEQQKSIAEKMIEGGELALSKIAEYSGLSLSTVRRLAKKLEASR